MKRAAEILRPLAMPLAYTAFTLLVFWYLWTPIADAARTFKYDPLHHYWADLSLQFETLARGELPLWNPFDRGGVPAYGDPQPGLLYPPNWPLWLWAGAVGEVSYSMMEVKVIAHWIFGAIGMHLLLRRRRCPEQACYVGGALFAFTPPGFRYGGNALNWSFAWIPWVLLAVDWYAERPGPRRAIVLGTTVAMALLAGAAAVFHYMLLIAVPFGLYLMWGRIKSSLSTIVLAGVVFLLWVLPTLASTLEVVPETVRSVRTVSWVTHSAYEFSHFMNLFLPRIEGEYTYYGLLPLMCFGLWVASRMDKLSLVLVGIVAASFLFAVGHTADFLASVSSVVESFTLFRHAHRYLYVTTVGMAMGCALGLAYVLSLADLERKRVLASRATKIMASICFLLAIGWIVTIVLSPKLRTAKANAFALATVSAVIYTWLMRGILLSKGRRRQVYAWIVVIMLPLDLWAVNSRSHHMSVGPKPDTTKDELLDRLDGVRDLEQRIYDRWWLQYRVGAREMVRDIGGYEDDPLALSRYAKFMAGVRRNMRTLGHANVRYFFDGPRNPPLRVRPTDRFAVLEKKVYEIPAVAPAVMYVPAPVAANSPDDAVRKLAAIEPGTGAVVEVERPATGPPGAQVVAGKVTKRSANSLVAEVDTPGPGLVVIAEAYFPVWTATVDGRDAEIVPANVMFRGVFVDGAGHHRIEMSFSPKRFWYLLPLWFIGMGLFVWAVIGEVRRRRRSSAA